MDERISSPVLVKSMKVNNSKKMMSNNKYETSVQTVVKWGPRSYNCTFCNREFKSAQALGGHMNVHRKERARQIRHPPHHHHFDNINVKPSEESWIRSRSPSSSPSKKLSPFGNSSALTTVKSLSLSPPSWGEIRKRTTNFMKKDNAKGTKLGFGLKNLVKDSKNQNLDLELRLGFSKN